MTDSIPRGDLRPLRDPDPQKNSFGQPDLNVRFGSKDSGTPDSKTIVLFPSPPLQPHAKKIPSLSLGQDPNAVSDSALECFGRGKNLLWATGGGFDPTGDHHPGSVATLQE